MRELHGALRLRADGRGPGDQAPAEGVEDRVVRREDYWSDGAGNLARKSTSGAVRVLAASAEEPDAAQRREGAEGRPKSRGECSRQGCGQARADASDRGGITSLPRNRKARPCAGLLFWGVREALRGVRLRG